MMRNVLELNVLGALLCVKAASGAHVGEARRQRAARW